MNPIDQIKLFQVEIKEKSFSKGEKINRISTLGAELVRLRQNRKGNWKIGFHMMEALCELAALGASLDEQGFVITE